MTNITEFKVKSNGSSYFKLLMTLLPTLMLFTTTIFINQYGYSQGNSSNMTTPATLQELDTEQFSQVVITSSQINELNNTLNSAIKATEHDNMSQVLLELIILQVSTIPI